MTNETKNTSTSTNESKNTTTFKDFLRHGKEPLMSELENYTFQDVVFEDGTIMENVTFLELANQVWTNINKS